MTTEITIAESKRLVELEAVITKGKQTFLEVGCALAEIRDGKLYRLEHDTFDAYCRQKWGWDRTYSHRLIEASQVVQMLPMGNKITNERQARELAKVPADDRAKVLEDAAKEGTTAKSIRKSAQKLSNQPTERTTDNTDNPNAGASDHEPDAPQSVELPHTQDEAWTKAIGVSNVRNFFASQVEDICESAIADGSEDQLHALMLELQVAAKKVKVAIQAKALATV